MNANPLTAGLGGPMPASDGLALPTHLLNSLSLSNISPSPSSGDGKGLFVS